MEEMLQAFDDNYPVDPCRNQQNLSIEHFKGSHHVSSLTVWGSGADFQNSMESFYEGEEKEKEQRVRLTKAPISPQGCLPWD